MTVWFISRHPGALAWLATQAIKVDRHVAHIAPSEVQHGDTVLGTLPVHLAAEVIARGARYFHLSLRVPATLRGHELSASQLEEFGAKLVEYQVTSSKNSEASLRLALAT